MTGELWTSM